MTPTPIVVPLTAPGTPVTFVLNGTGELEIKSVQATIDGSGAATFDAVLSVYTQDDRLISRTKPATAIAAGGSAIVTWAPFLRKAAAAAAGGGLSTFFYVRSNADQFVLAGGDDPVLLTTEQIKVGSPFTTADHLAFTLAAGYWLLGYQTLIDYVDTGTASRLIAYVENPDTSGQVASANTSEPAAPGTEYLESIGTVFEWNSVTQGPKVRLRFANLGGDTVTVSGGGFTYLCGVLLKAA